MAKLRNATLMLAIVLFGTVLGGVVYAHLVYFPVYLSALPASAVIVNGPYGLHESIFWATMHPLAVLSLIVALIVNWKVKPRRNLILIPLVVYILALIVTSFYFVPELRAFAGSPNSTVSPAEWLQRGQRWQRLSWTRGTCMYLSMIPLLLALTRSPNPDPENQSKGPFG